MEHIVFTDTKSSTVGLLERKKVGQRIIMNNITIILSVLLFLNCVIYARQKSIHARWINRSKQTYRILRYILLERLIQIFFFDQH